MALSKDSVTVFRLAYRALALILGTVSVYFQRDYPTLHCVLYTVPPCSKLSFIPKLSGMVTGIGGGRTCRIKLPAGFPILL